MKLYTNVMPFSFKWGKDNKPEFIEVGTTFAAIGADFNGIMIKMVSDINRGDEEIIPCSVNVELFKLAFKEIEQLAT